jgi:hypothetical protein
MSSNLEGESNGHGAIFMGIYIQLISRYMKLSYTRLVDSAFEYGLRVRIDARPVFL